MKLGLIARMDNTGLGNQTRGFYKHLKPDKVMVIDLSPLNGNQQHPEWYGEGVASNMFVRGLPNNDQIDRFLQDLDVVLTAETFYNDYLIIRAKELGVKTAVQYNYEFFTWLVQPHQPVPDLFIAPSMWNYESVEKFAIEHGAKHVYLHYPVDRDEIPPRELKQARTFLHIIGRPAAHDRNGTKIVIEATKHIRSDAKVLLHFQGEQGLGHQATETLEGYVEHIRHYGDKNKIIIRQEEYKTQAELYNDGEVMLLPRRYGGNCLPLNEALSVGLPVIMPDISPNNELLPPEWLIMAPWEAQFTPRVVVDMYAMSAVKLAHKIDKFYEMTERQFKSETAYANAIAEDISWGALESEYKEVLEELCK